MRCSKLHQCPSSSVIGFPRVNSAYCIFRTHSVLPVAIVVANHFEADDDITSWEKRAFANARTPTISYLTKTQKESKISAATDGAFLSLMHMCR